MSAKGDTEQGLRLLRIVADQGEALGALIAAVDQAVAKLPDSAVRNFLAASVVQATQVHCSASERFQELFERYADA